LEFAFFLSLRGIGEPVAVAGLSSDFTTLKARGGLFKTHTAAEKPSSSWRHEPLKLFYDQAQIKRLTGIPISLSNLGPAMAGVFAFWRRKRIYIAATKSGTWTAA
jgi:hypothetical protein